MVGIAGGTSDSRMEEKKWSEMEGATEGCNGGAERKVMGGFVVEM